MKKKIMTLVCAALIGAMTLTGCGTKTDDSQTETNTQTQATEQEKVTPTFMYFVSNSDAEFDAENATYQELETEYYGKVNFTLINIDEDTEAASNFPVQGNTPMVIMLNTSNDISAMSPQTSDKDALKEIIEAAME